MNKIKLEELYRFQPQRKVQGVLELAEDGFNLPVTVIDGHKPGLFILITAGIHGGEYTSIKTLHRLSQGLQPEKVTGKIVILPITNLGAFLERQAFVTPEDHKNLNRCFPGHKEGSYSQQLAYFLTQHLISKCDFYLDCHGGDLPEQLFPHLYYSKGYTNEQVGTWVAEIASYVKVDLKILSTSTGSSYQAAASLNIPSLLLERGANGTIEEENVQLYEQDLLNVLTGLGCLAGVKVQYDAPLIEEVAYLYAPAHGCWNPLITGGQRVKKGDVIGEVLNGVGDLMEEITAPVSGQVLYYVAAYAINQQELLCAIAVL
jgi:predicted deacylase